MPVNGVDRPASLDDLEGPQAPRGVAARRSTRQTVKRSEWSQPGALLHIDAYKGPRLTVPGHRVTGDRSRAGRASGLGHTVVIAVQDDHTRLVYAELHASEKAANVSVTLTRAARCFVEQGCGPVQAVMSDNAKCYARSHAFRRTLAELGARHILVPPYTLRWNGKIERFFGTLEDEWAHGRVWQPSHHRAAPSQYSPDTSTATDPTAPPAAEHPSPASTKSAGRTVAGAVRKPRLPVVRATRDHRARKMRSCSNLLH